MSSPDHISASRSLRLAGFEAGKSRACSPQARAQLCAPTSRRERRDVKQVEVGCIGVGWIGGLRAETLARTALVDKLPFAISARIASPR